MNKVVIPNILVFTVFVAGVIAFSPVDQATAVHTTIAANVEDQDRTLSLLVDAGASAESDLTVITLGTSDAFKAEGILTSMGTGACTLGNTGGENLIPGTVDDAVAATEFTAGITSGFDLGDDLILEAVPANTTCSLFLHIIEWE